MKRLCVFYYKANLWLGKRVQWIVCKECQRKLQQGEELHAAFGKAFPGYSPEAPAPKRKRKRRDFGDFGDYAM